MISKLRAAMAAGCLAAAPASASWFEAKSDHFIVYAEGGADAARDQAIELERFDKAMRAVREMPDDEAAKVNPLTVYVVADIPAVARLCTQLASAKAICKDVAGFYDGRISGSIAITPRRSGSGGEYDLSSRIVLYHEYSHHLMFRYFTAAYPAWFVEGFAEFNSTARMEKDGGVQIGSPALHRAYGLVLGSGIPIRKLLTARGPELKPEDRELLYGRGWLLCHYLIFSAERRGQLKHYLKAVMEGTPSLKAAEEAFGDLTALDRELDKYVNQRVWRTVVLPADKTAPGDVKVRELGPGQAAIMPVHIRSRRGVDERSAPDVLRAARIAAAPFPDDPAVQDALAEAEFDAGNDDLAAAAADRALAADPKDRTAMLYQGQVRARRAVRGKDSEPKTWAEVRRWFLKANRAEPNAPEPLFLFYASFLAQGIKPTANAVTGLEQAQALAPEVDELRLILGRQLILDTRKAEARAVLVPLAFNPHASPDNLAASLVAAIDSGNDDTLKSLLTGKKPD